MLSIFSCPYWPFVYLFFVINVCLDPLLILIWLFVFLLLSHKSSVNILDISQSRSAVWLCHTMDCSLPCSSLRGILQARILEWIAVSFSRGSSQPRDQTQNSHIAGGFFTIWATREAHEYWSGKPIPSPGDLPDPGIELGSPALQADLYQLSHQGSPSLDIRPLLIRYMIRYSLILRLSLNFLIISLEHKFLTWWSPLYLFSFFCCLCLWCHI